MSRQVTDHNGKQYNTAAKMCEAYGISYRTYLARIKAGWGLKRSLTTPLHSRAKALNGKSKWKDHKGNEFISAREMCEYWNVVSYTVFCKRIYNRKWSIEDALTKPLHYRLHPSSRKSCKDHLGNKYDSEQEMCDKYGVSLTLFCKRLSRGYTLEKALTKPVRRRVGK